MQLSYCHSHKVLKSNKKYKLLRFGLSGKLPVLIVFSFINSPVILDLEKENSFIKELIDLDLSVYVLHWNSPIDSALLSDYYIDFLDSAVQHIKLIHKVKPTLIGICQGGIFSFLYALKYGDLDLILISTPIDFTGSDNKIGMLSKYINFSLFEKFHLIPGKMIIQNLRLLNARELFQVEINRREHAKFNCWLEYCPDQASHLFISFATSFIQENSLYKKINKTNAFRGRIMQVNARTDHLIPPSSNDFLENLYNVKTLTIDGGHISPFYGRYSCLVAKEISSWLAL